MRRGATALACLLTGTVLAQTRSPLDLANASVPSNGRRISYGSDPLQYGELRLPTSKGPHPVAIIVHGGCWLAKLGNLDERAISMEMIRPVAAALTDAGIATWNVEYRRVGDPGGGWPGSLEDVLRAVEHARTLAERLVLVGHSAGGHLALLAAARVQLPVVAIAAVSDPATWDHPAVPLLLGDERPAEASPLAQLPLGAPQILVHGTADEVVPFDQSERYSEAAGGEAELVALEGAGHFEPIDPQSPEWTTVRDAIRRLL